MSRLDEQLWIAGEALRARDLVVLGSTSGTVRPVKAAHCEGNSRNGRGQPGLGCWPKSACTIPGMTVTCACPCVDCHAAGPIPHDGWTCPYTPAPPAKVGGRVQIVGSAMTDTVATVEAPADCPECWGTGCFRGFGAPCSKGCKER
jgi:hypothetical protein